MSYNQGYGQHGQQAQQGYGSYNPYGSSGNPYEQQSNAYGQQPQQQQPYGHQGNYSERPDLDHQTSSRYDEESAQGSSYEMSNMNSRDPNRILNEVRTIDGQLNQLDQELSRLRELHKAFLGSTDSSQTSPLGKEVQTKAEDIMATYMNLVARVKKIRLDPDAQLPRNKAQVGKVDRRLRAAINQCQQVDREYREGNKAQIARNYRIVRPEASEAEVREAVEDSGNQQVFSNALITSDRRGEAQTIARRVNERHEAIRKIEEDMVKLAELFNELEALVVQQEPAVTQIEEKGMEATGHVAQANTELDGAVKKARSARKKKWMCLGLVILILIIIAVAVALGVTLTKR